MHEQDRNKLAGYCNEEGHKIFMRIFAFPIHGICIIHLPFALTCFVLRNNSSDCLSQAGKDISSDDLFLNNAPYIPPFMICPYMATGVKLAGLNMYTEKEQFLN